MMIIFTISTIFLLVAGSLASGVANQYVDNILYTTLQNELQLRKLDPVPLPDFQNVVYDKLPLIGKVKITADYDEGQLFDLSKVQRLGDCDGPRTSLGSKSINCTLVFQSLYSDYKGHMKYGKLPTVTIRARANTTENTLVFFEITRPISGFVAGGVKMFDVKNVGALSTKFSGLGGALNRFLNVLEEDYKKRITAEIYIALVQKFQSALNSAVLQVPMPME